MYSDAAFVPRRMYHELLIRGQSIYELRFRHGGYLRLSIHPSPMYYEALIQSFPYSLPLLIIDQPITSSPPTSNLREMYSRVLTVFQTPKGSLGLRGGVGSQKE